MKCSSKPRLTIRLITHNPPGKYRTKRLPARVAVPVFQGSVIDYIGNFTKLNNLLPSEFTLYSITKIFA